MPNPVVLRPCRLMPLLLLAALVSGCATAPPDAAVQARAWEAHHVWLTGLSRWRTSGKVAVDVPADSWSANLRWQQRDDGYRIWLGGPFGQGAVNIDGDDASVRLRTADGRTAEAATPEALLAGEIGAEVPISRLRYWIVGRPAPGEPVTAMSLDDEGRLETLEQSGWQVRYEEYEAAGAGHLPARLEIRRGDTRARFVLARWQPGT